MPIRDRKYEGGKVRYTVECPSCRHVFQSGKNPNLWRTIKSKYKMAPSEVRRLQSNTMAYFLTHNAPPDIEDTGAALFIDNRLVAYRKKEDHGKPH